MQQNFKITKEGEHPIVITADTRDGLVFERSNRRGRTAVDLGSGATIEDQYDLAYIAARRTGALDVPRKEFDADYLVEAVGEQEEVDPTNEGP